MPEAATPTGGAEGRPAQSQSTTGQFAGNSGGGKASVQDRLKASLFVPDEPQPDKDRAIPRQDEPDDKGGDPERNASPPVDDEKVEQQQAADDQVDDAQKSGAQDEDQSETIRSLNDLAEGLGWDLEKVLDLETPTKINGKDGKVRLRDLVKSHQLEGHLNQGLMRLAEDRKGFEAETARRVNEMQGRVQQLNQAVGLAQRILDGEFADTNWQELQQTDPAAFQAKYGAYKMRLDGIQQLSQAVQQESQRTQSQQQTAFKAYLTEQQTLLDSKIPEWSDKGKREKDVAEMAAILNEAYGLTEAELKSATDHRQIMIARDAMRWQKLQKSKPATLNKVRQAPKLIRPGTQQSRAANDGLEIQKGRDALRRTGRVQDAAPLLKKLIFSSN